MTDQQRKPERLEHLGLKLSGASISVAESCTGGLLGGMLTSLSGSSKFFLGGVIAYSNELKVKLLGVDADILAQFGAVSSQTAEAMAAGIKSVTGSQYSISVTGVAGPTGGNDRCPVGTVYIGIASPRGVTSKRFNFVGDRESIRNQSVEAALSFLVHNL